MKGVVRGGTLRGNSVTEIINNAGEDGSKLLRNAAR